MCKKAVTSKLLTKTRSQPDIECFKTTFTLTTMKTVRMGPFAWFRAINSFRMLARFRIFPTTLYMSNLWKALVMMRSPFCYKGTVLLKMIRRARRFRDKSFTKVVQT